VLFVADVSFVELWWASLWPVLLLLWFVEEAYSVGLVAVAGVAFFSLSGGNISTLS
jgi:hypothetical protein